MPEGWHRLHDDQDEEYNKVASSLPPAGKKDLAAKGKGRMLKMNPRAVLMIGVVIGALLGGLGVHVFAPQTTVQGPGAKATLSVTPTPIQLNSFTMVWPSGPFTIGLSNTGTGSASGTCTATFSTSTGPITGGQGSQAYGPVVAGASANVAITVTVDVSTASSIVVQC